MTIKLTNKVQVPGATSPNRHCASLTTVRDRLLLGYEPHYPANPGLILRTSTDGTTWTADSDYALLQDSAVLMGRPQDDTYFLMSAMPYLQVEVMKLGVHGGTGGFLFHDSSQSQPGLTYAGNESWMAWARSADKQISILGWRWGAIPDSATPGKVTLSETTNASPSMARR